MKRVISSDCGFTARVGGRECLRSGIWHRTAVRIPATNGGYSASNACEKNIRGRSAANTTQR